MAKSSKAVKGIGGWLAVVLVVMALSLLSALIMAAQRLSLVFAKNASSGVYISLAFLLPYIALLAYTIYLIFRKREDAVTMFVSSAIIGTLFVTWFFVIGQIIYAPALFKAVWIFSTLMAACNIAILISVAAYLLKSKRVQNTLTKK